MAILDTAGLGETVGGRPAWQWALMGGIGIAVVAYLRRSKTTAAGTGPVMLNPALSLLGGGGGTGGGTGGGGGSYVCPDGSVVSDPSQCASAPPPGGGSGGSWASCAAAHPIQWFPVGAKGGDASGAYPFAFFDCLFGGVKDCGSLSGQAAAYCAGLTNPASHFQLHALGPDGCLYVYNPLTGMKSKLFPSCGGQSAAGAQHDGFTPLHTASVHPQQAITPGR